MIQLHVAEGSPDGTSKVVQVIRSGWERDVLLCATHMMSRELRMLAVC